MVLKLMVGALMQNLVKGFADIKHSGMDTFIILYDILCKL